MWGGIGGYCASQSHIRISSCDLSMVPSNLPFAYFIQAKFCKDARLLDKDKFPKPAVDMVWTTVARTEKKVTYTGFVELLKGVAVKKGVEYSVIEAHVLENAKVSNSGTKGASRFHDDKSTYTGTHIGK